MQLYLKDTPTQIFSCKVSQIFKNIFFTEHLQWLLLERVCEETSLVKILQSCHFNVFVINHRCFRRMLIKENNEQPRLLKRLSLLLLFLRKYCYKQEKISLNRVVQGRCKGLFFSAYLVGTVE